MADSIFTLENLSFAYGRHEVIRSLDLTLREGKITTLIGANGCGKSTLFSLMTKNLRPDGGRILMQQRVPVFASDTPETLQHRVMEQAEWVLLPRAVEQLCFHRRGGVAPDQARID